MKRIMYAFALLLVIVIVTIIGTILYIRPMEALDLNYGEVSILQKFNQMLRNRQLALELDESDINHLLKKQLSEQKHITPDIEIVGAKFHTEQDQLTAHVNLRVKGSLIIGMTQVYRLQWDDPYLIADLQSSRIKDFKIPVNWLKSKSLRIPVKEKLPQAIGIRQVTFEQDQIRVWFKLDLF